MEGSKWLSNLEGLELELFDEVDGNDVWQLGIAFDKFIRTTDEHHEVLVAEFYKRVEAKGDIYQAKYEGLYCVGCEEYKVLAINHLCMLYCKQFAS